MNNRVEILDSTLRDGVQGLGVVYSIADKLNIIKILDNMGVDVIEIGNPSSNPKDKELFETIKGISLKTSKVAAFGSTRRKNTLASEDKALNETLMADTDICVIFGKCSLFHVKYVLETTEKENLAMIKDSCSFLCCKGKTVYFDAEHFFDGYKENKEYALDCLKAAVDGGAKLLCLCDTNGGSFPEEAKKIMLDVKKHFNVKVAVHFHNDSGMAVANSIMCAEGGADQIQGTFLGIGERCGNANLSTIIPNLQLKLGINCIPEQNLQKITMYAKEISAIGNTDISPSMPYVGGNAFAHKAGMHASGVIKTPKSFEHINPELVGNSRKFPTSEISGRSIIIERIKTLFPKLGGESQEANKILEEIKRLESIGYQFESADASFELLVRKQLGLFGKFFRLIYYRIYTGVGVNEEYSASATVKVQVGNKVQLMAAEGNGPVNALDKALRKALESFYPELSKIKLTDYKVRVLDTGDATAASVRVLISSSDGINDFTTVGVSQDVVDASWKALEDSIEYILLKYRG